MQIDGAILPSHTDRGYSISIVPIQNAFEKPFCFFIQIPFLENVDKPEVKHIAPITIVIRTGRNNSTTMLDGF